jgi:NTE family protein
MKGLAHIGVLQALTERGLLPTHVVGSSVGALVGAAWATGRSVVELREIAINLRRKDVFVVAHADMAFKRMRSPALFRREPLDGLIERLVGDITFQDLRHPLVVNTVDINSGMQVFWGLEGLEDVPVRDAVFASCALPGYLPPREIRGRFYVDGATVDNLPVGTGRVLGADLILAVDVSASNAFRADVQEEGFAPVFARATEIAMQSLLELRMREWTTPPIFYIHPRVEHISPFSFDHLRELVEEGYRATIAALDRPEEWPAPGDAGVHPKRRVIVRVQRERCIGCGACLIQAAPGMFVLDAQGKAVVTRPEQEWSPIDGEFIRHCPTYAISARPVAAPKAADAAG